MSRLKSTNSNANSSSLASKKHTIEDDEDIIEEDILVIGNFPELDDVHILDKIETVDLKGHQIFEISDLHTSKPTAVIQNRMEFIGKHEINIGNFLIFKEEKTPVTNTTNSSSSSAPPPPTSVSKINYFGTCTGQLEFELSHVRTFEDDVGKAGIFPPPKPPKTPSKAKAKADADVDPNTET